MAHAAITGFNSTLTTSPQHRVQIEEEKVFANLGPLEERDDRRWVLDTGATNHMIDSHHFFSKLKTQVCGQVMFSDGSVTKIEGRGTIILACKNGEHRALTGVYYIPRLKTSILSIGQLDEIRCRIAVFSGVLQVYDLTSKLLAKVKHTTLHLYYHDINMGQSVCLATRTSEATWLWHARFRHLNFGSLRRLATQDMVRGLPVREQANQVCDGCMIGKQRHALFPGQA
jgi:hypothetical protein